MFLGAVAAISLLLAIGITNTMFTSVLERTKEIGVLKSIELQMTMFCKFLFLKALCLVLLGV